MALDGIPIVGLTAPALLGIFVLMVFLRKLIPEATYKEKVEEAEKWRLAFEKSDEARRLSEAQTTELLELAKTTHSIVFALFGSTEYLRKSGGIGVISSTAQE